MLETVSISVIYYSYFQISNTQQYIRKKQQKFYSLPTRYNKMGRFEQRPFANF